MILLKQMAILFIIMMIGFLCRKLKLINDEGAKVISGLVVNVANPALILSASINNENSIKGMDLVKAMGLAVVMYVVLGIIAFVIPKLLAVPKADAGAYRVMTIFSNIGFMGFPVISALYGSDALLYASLFMIPYNVLIYTYGISAMRGGRGKAESVGSSDNTVNGAAGDKKHKLPIGKIINVGVVSCILTIIIYIINPPVPEFIETTIGHLSGLTAPLSMIVIGDAMGKMKFRELVKDFRLWIFSAIKLLVIPIAGMAVIRLLGLDATLSGVLMIMLSTPVGSMTAMLANRYGGNYELTSRGVALTTLLSVITMPVVSIIVNAF